MNFHRSLFILNKGQVWSQRTTNDASDSGKSIVRGWVEMFNILTSIKSNYNFKGRQMHWFSSLFIFLSFCLSVSRTFFLSMTVFSGNFFHECFRCISYCFASLTFKQQLADKTSFLFSLFQSKRIINVEREWRRKWGNIKKIKNKRLHFL